jgi:hypothetical protein
MPNPLILPIDTGMIFKVASTLNRLSDHNRSPIAVTMDRIENRKRMADATMRTFVVATKRMWKTSWEDLPREDNQTADGFWGSESLIQFYQSTLGSFELVITNGNNETETTTVMFDNFDFKLTKRSRYTDFYDIDLSIVEV